jgi:cephalosporin-C deacetylase-like acetyl esterase
MMDLRWAGGAFAVVLAALGVAACSNERREEDRGPDSRGPFAYDPQRPLAVRKGMTAVERDVVVEEVSFAAADGERVPALFVRPRGIRGPFTCLIQQGGLGSRKARARGLRPGLASARIASFTIDARFHGERARPGLGPVEASRVPRLLERMIRLSVVDLRRGVDYLQDREDCDSEAIGYLGVSFGGLLGTLLAGVDARVKAPVLMVTGADWRTILEGSDALLPGIERDRRRFRAALRLLGPLEPATWARRISPRPVFIVLARQDRSIVPAAGKALVAAARRPKRVFAFNGGHGDLLGSKSLEVGARLAHWLDAELLAGGR